MQKILSLAAVFAVVGAHAADSQAPHHLIAHYPDKQLEDVKSLVLPRVFLYDSRDRLVPDEQWPTELAELRKHKGDGRCCLIYHKYSGKGPPPECAAMLYGDEGANWEGLMDTSGSRFDLRSVPAHKWLIVEYAASWCAPCVVQEKLLNRFFASNSSASEYAWLTVDMTRITEIKDAAKKAQGTL